MLDTAEIRTPVRPRVDAPPLARDLPRDRSLLLLLALPLVLLALDPRWIYGIASRDSWLYYGYYRHAAAYAREFPGLYYSSRLSVVLPGWLLHRMLPPEPAQVVLHLGLFWAAVLSFHAVCRSWLDRRTALLAAVALGCNPFFLRSIGWNYVDGFGLAFFLGTFLALTLALRGGSRRAWRAWLVLAGAGATALVTANLFYGVYLPFLALYVLLANRNDRAEPVDRVDPADRNGERRPFAAVVLLPAAGAAAMFFVFGGFNRLLGGPFFYLLPSLRFITGSVGMANPFRDSSYAWVSSATWLVFPALVLAAAAPLLFRRQRELGPGRRWFARFAQLQLAGLVALLVFFQVAGDTAVLQHGYYAVLLLPVAFLAFAAQLRPGLEGLTPRAWTLILATELAAFVLAHVLAFGPGNLAPWVRVPVLAALAAGAGVIVAPWPRRHPGAGAATLVAVLSLALCNLLAWDTSPAARDFEQFGGDMRGLFHQVDGAARRIDARDPESRIRLWYDLEDGEAGLLSDVIASTFLLCPRMVGGNFPVLLYGAILCDGAPMVPGTRIALLSRRPEDLARADAALRSVGLAARVEGREEVPGPVRGFSITFLEAVPALPETPAKAVP